MVLLLSALQHAENTMKKTIDDADYIINWINFIFFNQCVKNSAHSHSIVNEPFLSLYIQWLNFLLIGNAMKNTMLGNSLKKYNYILPDGPFISS